MTVMIARGFADLLTSSIGEVTAASVMFRNAQLQDTLRQVMRIRAN
jgi:hypothetical protein